MLETKKLPMNKLLHVVIAICLVGALVATAGCGVAKLIADETVIIGAGYDEVYYFEIQRPAVLNGTIEVMSDNRWVDCYLMEFSTWGGSVLNLQEPCIDVRLRATRYNFETPLDRGEYYFVIDTQPQSLEDVGEDIVVSVYLKLES